MPYTRQQGNDFWFEYDDHFLFHPSTEVRQALQIIRGADYIRTRWKERRRTNTYPAGFLTDVTTLRAGLVTLSRHQLQIVDRHFPADTESLRLAFEDFGQGVLFDDRRQPGTKVHMMDTSSPANPPIGYHRWHTIISALLLLDIDAARWAELNKYVTLAWAIQSEALPVQDTHNPGLSAIRVQAHRDFWLLKTLPELDAAFDSFPYPAVLP